MKPEPLVDDAEVILFNRADCELEEETRSAGRCVGRRMCTHDVCRVYTRTDDLEADFCVVLDVLVKKS